MSELEKWLGHIESVHFRSIDMELGRVLAVLGRVLPSGPGFRSINVAGTNGKGTAVEALSSVLQQTGMHVGTYTSPHLVRYTERVKVDGVEVGEAELCRAFATIDKAREGTPLTYFEFGTLAALLIFQNRGVEIAVLEVGMGGRLDAVNAVDPCAALITSISIDHELWLGSDRESIAFEKAGIFRSGTPAICADPTPPRAIADQAEVVGADLYQLGKEFEITEHSNRWEWSGPGIQIDLPEMPMRQFRANIVAGVLMTLTCIKHIVDLDAGQIRQGLSSMRMRGRCEIIDSRPQIVLDVAHNVAALEVLHDTLKSDRTAGRTLAVCGMLKDKPVGVMADILEPVIDAWYLGTIHDPRGSTSEELKDKIERSSDKPVSAHGSVLGAFHAAHHAAGPSDRIVVFGSFHTVGDIIRALEGDRTEH